MTAHERYRRELTLLQDDDHVRAELGLDAGWRRTYGRFFPDAEPFASLTLEKCDRLLRVDVHTGMRYVATDATMPGTIRYHPGLRRTIRRGDRFGKLAPDAPRLLELQRRVYAARDHLGFAVAEPLGLEDGIAWFSAVPGEPVSFTPELAQRAGAALATLHRAPIAADPAPDRYAGPAQELIRRIPSLRQQVEHLMGPIDPGTPKPIHGAPHPPQWLLENDTFGLIDFDRLALGDTEADVATFMEAADEGAAFMTGYDGPLDEQRLAAYRGRRKILKALRAASALRPDGDERAARRLR